MIFFAIVGVALVGGENQAVAGHGCHGCSCDCDGDDSCGGDECCGGGECSSDDVIDAEYEVKDDKS